MADLSIIHQREATLTHYKSLGLKGCGQHDYNLGLKQKMTGWGVVSASRTGKGISRSDRVKRNKAK